MIPHDSANIEMQHQLSQEKSDRFLSRLIKSVTGPLPVLAGPGLSARDGHPGQPVVGDDPELLAKTQHVRKPKERLMEFIARVGMSPNQMRTLSKEEISRFVATVSQHEQLNAPAGMFGQPAPQRFVLEA